MSPVNLSHIDACTQDATLAWGSAVAGPADPADWGDMIAAVQAAQRACPTGRSSPIPRSSICLAARAAYDARACLGKALARPETEAG